MKIHIYQHDSINIIDCETGYFSRSRNGELFVTGSDSWICTGAVITNNFGNVTQRLSLADLADRLANAPDSLFCKNGKARFYITDIDHGTHRAQVRPQVYRHHVSIA